MIKFFYKKLYPSIQTQLDNQGQYLDLQENVIRKTIDVKIKTSLKSLFQTWEINSRYPKDNRPLAKKILDNANWENKDGNKDKAKFHNPSSTNSQPQAQVSKKNKHYRSRQEGYPAIWVNVIKVAKKNKDTTKDLSYIECDTSKQKGH